MQPEQGHEVEDSGVEAGTPCQIPGLGLDGLEGVQELSRGAGRGAEDTSRCRGQGTERADRATGTRRVTQMLVSMTSSVHRPKS